MKIKLFTVPNIITLMNLICGAVAVVFAIKFENLQAAFMFIVLAAIFDFLDGFMARLLGAYSEVGKQLDSLADMVSFGLAPSAILFTIFSLSGGEGWIGYSVFILAAFSALRLAKFNIDDSQSYEFVGLPTPACALFVASSGYLMQEYLFVANPYYIIGIAICLSWFLISNIRMFALKFKSYAIKDNVLRYSFLGLSLIAIVIFRIAAIPFIIMGYILVSAARSAVCSK